VKVKFLKGNHFYRGNQYKKDDVIEISEIDVKAFLECKVVEIYIEKKKKKDINEMTYRELQKECKEKNLQAVGKKNDLIASLIEKSENNCKQDELQTLV
jgi:CxxC motif-containing protein